MIRMISKLKMMTVLAAVGVLALAAPAQAVRIRDVARLRGEMPQEIVGMGLVVGLKGTGDGGDVLPAIRPLKQLLTRFENPVTLEKELKEVNNVALVWVTVSLPAKGINEGDKLDVKVSSVLKAKSLNGGRLIWCPLMNPLEREPTAEERQTLGKIGKTIYGVASGTLIVDDEKQPTQAVIKDGAVMLANYQAKTVTKIGNDSYVYLYLRPAVASPELATAMAELINQEVKTQTEGKEIAVALDATAVAVKIPEAEAKNPTTFVAWMNSLPLPNIPGPAKVLINTKTKTIIFTDEVELAPTMITHNGLTVTVGGGDGGGGAERTS